MDSGRKYLTKAGHTRHTIIVRGKYWPNDQQDKLSGPRIRRQTLNNVASTNGLHLQLAIAPLSFTRRHNGASTIIYNSNDCCLLI